MKINKLYILLSVLLLVVHTSVAAQEVTSVHSLLQELQSDAPGQGVIRIHQSPTVVSTLRLRSAGGVEEGERRFQNMMGFRVQIYSGNAANSKSIAADRVAQVRAQFPELESQTIYNAPFWRVQVGNFVTREEAQACLERIKEAFPTFGRSMYIVRTTVKIPV